MAEFEASTDPTKERRVLDPVACRLRSDNVFKRTTPTAVSIVTLICRAAHAITVLQPSKASSSLATKPEIVTVVELPSNVKYCPKSGSKLLRPVQSLHATKPLIGFPESKFGALLSGIIRTKNLSAEVGNVVLLYTS